ncbi:DUF294 nucleotidyltransferase-like domain-containing protein [Bacillus sp. FJAT-44742]|uniref:DUF294 nucleotidyltransferase-like domain-containing protein n=1 Tax=Bacillus sp. FJAT-44742 TaxID=2014005 RepID=UPI000C24AEB4|nr:DUF294 nucleotidyltransferase-like domain-containing protein [Bacillus sp. FJAT-44742]
MSLQENNIYYNQINNHPLFSGASAAEFGAFMEDCNLREYEKGDTVLFSKTPREGLLLILEGMTEVYVNTKEGHSSQEVLEVLEAGDIIGFSSLADFLGQPSEVEVNYTVEVQAVEKSVCLQIPYSVLEKRWDKEEVREYVLRQVSVRLRDIYASLAEQVQLASQWGESEAFIRRVQDIMTTPPIVVDQETEVDDIARIMVKESTSSVVVEDEDRKLVGIITEKDLVHRVVAKGMASGLRARTIMTPRPFTIQRQAYYYEAMSSFLMNRVKHLPVVDENESVKGMLTLSDLLRQQNRGKFEILQEVEESNAETLPHVKKAIYEVLGNLIQDKIPTLQILNIITQLFDRLVRHCVVLAVESVEEKGYGKPPVAFSFYLMGSGGRGEQFMLTDQDHFLVYEDPEDDQDPDDIEMYFRMLGGEIVLWLERAGYRPCDGNMMASEHSWRGSVSKWAERLRTWGVRATNENILLGHNFLAFRYLYGEEAVDEQFTKMVLQQMEKSRIFLYRAAEQEKASPVQTLDHPIRALFRLKKESIDIKKNALFPFHHSLQILAAHHGVVGGVPIDQIKKLTRKGVFTEAFEDELLFAYEIVLKIWVEQSWNRYSRGEQSSSEIKFTHIKSRDKEELMIALKTIRSLQNQAIGAFGMM